MVVSEPTFVELSPAIAEPKPVTYGVASIICGNAHIEKRLDVGAFAWPRTESEALAISPEQYRLLMSGFTIVAKHPISELKERKEIV